MSWSERRESVLFNSTHKSRLGPSHQRVAEIPEAQGISPAQPPTIMEGQEWKWWTQPDPVLPSSCGTPSKPRAVEHWCGHRAALLKPCSWLGLATIPTGSKGIIPTILYLSSAFIGTQCARNCMNRDEGPVPSLMKSSSQTQHGQEMIMWLEFSLAMFS